MKRSNVQMSSHIISHSARKFLILKHLIDNTE